MRVFEADVNRSQTVVNTKQGKTIFLHKRKFFYGHFFYFLFRAICPACKRIGKEYKISCFQEYFILFFVAKKSESDNSKALRDYFILSIIN